MWIVQEQGLSMPRIYCHVCGELITGATGIIVYHAGLEVAQPWFVHKGACDRKMEARAGRWMPWLDFDRAVVRLMHDAEVDVVGASQRDAFIRRLG
jgi:hypothetical protein